MYTRGLPQSGALSTSNGNTTKGSVVKKYKHPASCPLEIANSAEMLPTTERFTTFQVEFIH
ncbi:hypothetical protein T12_5150 [Trichinella patagoniensis]|uniref:Uncharacterized protein n=1 Tax=Trichinella patagoniensis TaxID=990121 RepID=A0A0V0ZXU4_9BILA|nr:hypothetical protein T12_5150 [Trichinella patagoniensis]